MESSKKPLTDVPARIAILALSARSSTVPRTFSINSDTDSLTVDRVAERLAKIPKPLNVSGLFEGDHCQIRAVPIQKGSIEERVYESFQESCQTTGGAVDFLARRHTGDLSGLRVLCVAGRQFLTAKVDEVREWQRDYWVERAGYAADFADSRYAAGLGLSASDIDGIAAVIAFSTEGGTWTSSVNGVIDMRGTF